MFEGCAGCRCGVVGRQASCFSGYVCRTVGGGEVGGVLFSLSLLEEKELMNEVTVEIARLVQHHHKRMWAQKLKHLLRERADILMVLLGYGTKRMYGVVWKSLFEPGVPATLRCYRVPTETKSDHQANKVREWQIVHSEQKQRRRERARR